MASKIKAGKILNSFRSLNRERFSNPDVYLFVGEYLNRKFIVTNLDIKNIGLPKDYLYKDGTVIIQETPYEVVSREEYRRLN